jgi:hypothetical protein
LLLGTLGNWWITRCLKMSCARCLFWIILCPRSSLRNHFIFCRPWLELRQCQMYWSLSLLMSICFNSFQLSTCSVFFISNESMHSFRQLPFQPGVAHVSTDWLLPLCIHCGSSRFHLAFGTTFHRDPWCILLLLHGHRQGPVWRFMERLPETPKKQGSCEHFSLILLCFPLKPRTQNPRTRRGFPCSTLELGRLVPVLIVKCFGTALVIRDCFRSVSWPTANGVSDFLGRQTTTHTHKRFPMVSVHSAQIMYPLSAFLHGSLLDFVSFLSVGAWHGLPKYVEVPCFGCPRPFRQQLDFHGFPTHRLRRNPSGQDTAMAKAMPATVTSASVALDMRSSRPERKVPSGVTCDWWLSVLCHHLSRQKKVWK